MNRVLGVSSSIIKFNVLRVFSMTSASSSFLSYRADDLNLEEGHDGGSERISEDDLVPEWKLKKWEFKKRFVSIP
jgi:hypothetical protein